MGCVLELAAAMGSSFVRHLEEKCLRIVHQLTVLSAVHEFRMANAKPSIDSGEKFRFSSCWTPRAAR